MHTRGHFGKTNPRLFDTSRQGRRDNFRAPEKKFRLGPLISGAPKTHDEQKKVIASADVRISVQNQVMSKKRVIAPQLFKFRLKI